MYDPSKEDEERLWEFRLQEAEEAFELEYLKEWESLVNDIAKDFYFSEEDIKSWKEAGRPYARRFAQEATLLGYHSKKEKDTEDGDDRA